MKEKIKEIVVTIAEIGTVALAIYGMWGVIKFRFLAWFLSENEIKILSAMMEGGSNILLVQLLFVFLSAVLILYLLRKYARKI